MNPDTQPRVNKNPEKYCGFASTLGADHPHPVLSFFGTGYPYMVMYLTCVYNLETNLLLGVNNMPRILA